MPPPDMNNPLPLAISPLTNHATSANNRNGLNLPVPPQINVHDAIPIVSGTLAFTTLLSISTLMQLKLFRISTGTPPPVPTLFGIVTVATAAYSSHWASIKAFQMTRLDDSKIRANFNLTKFSRAQDSIDALWHHDAKHLVDFQRDDIGHTLRVCALGLLAFKGLGGRFWSIAPSNITNLGSFARTIFSIPATEKYATPSQRKVIEKLGRTIGCHTCGSRKIFTRGPNGVKFIADHMPPQAVVKQMNARWYRRWFGLKVKQRFYPQCFTCSNLQGGILSKATQQLKEENSKYFSLRGKMINLSNAGGGRNAYNHAFRFRKEHFAGGLVAAATTLDANESDVLGDRRSSSGGIHRKSGNRKRFLEWQNQVENIFYGAIETFQKYVSFK